MDMIEVLSNHAIATGKVSPKDAFRVIDNAINNFGFNPDKIIDVINPESQKESLLKLVAAWIAIAADRFGENMYDGRNEYSFGILHKISKTTTADVLFDGKLFPMKQVARQSRMRMNLVTEALAPEYQIALMMSDSHRTLQQTFSKFIFKLLDRLEHESFEEMLKEAGVEYDSVMYVPMI